MLVIGNQNEQCMHGVKGGTWKLERCMLAANACEEKGGGGDQLRGRCLPPLSETVTSSIPFSSPCEERNESVIVGNEMSKVYYCLTVILFCGH